MRRVKALFYKTANFLTGKLPFRGGRVASFTIPLDMSGPELELFVEVLCDQLLTHRRCTTCEAREAVN